MLEKRENLKERNTTTVLLLLAEVVEMTVEVANKVGVRERATNLVLVLEIDQGLCVNFIRRVRKFQIMIEIMNIVPAKMVLVSCLRVKKDMKMSMIILRLVKVVKVLLHGITLRMPRVGVGEDGLRRNWGKERKETLHTMPLLRSNSSSCISLVDWL